MPTGVLAMFGIFAIAAVTTFIALVCGIAVGDMLFDVIFADDLMGE